MASIYHLLDEKEAFSERDGGAISRWAANVLREGNEVVICHSSDSSWDFPAERVYEWSLWSLVGPVHPVIYRLPWTLQNLIYRRVFKPLLKKLSRGDLIYVHNRPACAAALAPMARKHGIRVVLHMHNSILRANRGQIEALRKVPIVFCSDFLRMEAAAALPNHFEEMYVVYNGADPKKFRSKEGCRDSVPTVIFTGRIVPHKGVHVLLEAMQILENEGVNVRCQVVGGVRFGSSRSNKYMRRLYRLKASNTELMGYMVGDSVAELLRNASVFCCPSIWNDPFPLAPLEAMATGLPVVASNVGGLPEMFAYGGGLLVPPNDSRALANALARLVRDEPYRVEVSLKARESFSSHFLWSSVRDQYLRVVQGLQC
ncbi:MAG: glycosyltransferase family 4 protein [Terracidiphilus sp.]